MSDLLPPETIDSILSHLAGTASILKCALVCSTWLPSARRYLLPPPGVLHLDQPRIIGFLYLITVPKSTLLLAARSIHTLILVHKQMPGTMAREGWRYQDSINKFLTVTKNYKCDTVETLFLEAIDWKTLSRDALASLHSNYTTVRYLNLKLIAFSYAEFRTLLVSLTALEKIAFANNRVPVEGGTTWPDNSRERWTHPTLSKLEFGLNVAFRTFLTFSRGMRYQSGIDELSCDMSVSRRNWFQFTGGFGELLDLSGSGLRTLKIRTSIFDVEEDDDVASPLVRFFGFSKNPNLEEIVLDTVTEHVLLLFIRGLRQYRKQELLHFKLVLTNWHDLERWKETWSQLDMALFENQQIHKDPRLTVVIGVYSNYIVDADPQLGTPETVVIPTVETALTTLRRMLPRMAESWKFEVFLRHYTTI